MSDSILYMSMSLDGFIAGANDGPDNGLGDGGDVLHAWLNTSGDTSPPRFDPEGESRRVFDEIFATGAAVVGRKMFDYAGQWGGDHHDDIPIFVPTRGEPPEPISENVHYVTDGLESAMRQAKQAAGESDVMVHGAELAQSLLRARVLDKLEISLVPVLLGSGRRLFNGLDDEDIELEIERVLEAPGVTHVRYRVAS